MENLTSYSDNISISQIDHIDFDIWGNIEIKRISALGDNMGIELPVLYGDSEPQKGGLIDSRLGPSGNDICATCGQNATWCVGHFGHIELAEYVYHIGYLQFVSKILSCVCIRCSKLLINGDSLAIKDALKNKTGKERLTYIRSLTKNINKCPNVPGCGAVVPMIKTDFKKSSSSINIVAIINQEISKEQILQGESKKQLKQILTPDIIYDILKNISDDHCSMVGIDPSRSRPEDMIQKIFPVPPVQMRPSIRGDFMGGSTREDDLTTQLAHIVKANARLLKDKEKNNDINAKYVSENVHLLQFQCASYIKTDSMQMPKIEVKGKPLKTLSTRIQAKEGRIRGNLMGKRGDFTARTVITSDPTIDNNQLGVPVKIAMNLTFPEVVKPNNIERLTELVRRGNDNYPGAKFVFPCNTTGRKSLPIDLRWAKEKIELKVGDIVERHLINDDIILLNRQPTLHKHSMMGHRIKVINDPDLLTFRLSVAVTKPYNADFDGDEMNGIVPQSLKTQIELEEIACAEKQIITPTSSVAIIGIVQDGLIGAYLITGPNMQIDWRSAMNLMAYTSLEDYSSIKKNTTISGCDLFSLIIPQNVSIDRPTLKIKNGKIIEGRINKSYLAPKEKNNLIQLIWDIYGVDETKSFIDDTQRLINNFNLYNGFTLGVKDTHITDKIFEQIKLISNTKELETEFMITEIENNPNMMAVDVFEKKLFSEYGTIRDESMKLIVNNLTPDNSLHVTVKAGSTGDETNIGQISGCVGLQTFEGKMIAKKYNKRTLAYYHQNDDRAPARGLIKNSFINGIEFPEFVFHLLTSRSDVIGTAIKTAETGYAQRRIVKSMEDIMVKNDGTVRTSNDLLLQVVYGNSGADTTRQYIYDIKIIEMNNETIDNKYRFTKTEINELKDKFYTEEINDKFYKLVLDSRDNLRVSVRNAKQEYVTLTTEYMLPINLRRIVDNAINLNIENNSKTNITPTYILTKLEDLMLNMNTTLICMTETEQKNKKSLKNRDEMIHKLILKIALIDALAPKRIIKEYGLNIKQFDKIIEDIKITFNKNIIEAGEMAGIIAGQSMGEPLTQMTLSSFHKAGLVSLVSTTQGIPRVKELLSVSKNSKSPQMIIYLEDNYKNNKDIANKIASHLKYTTIEHLREKISVYFDPYPNEKNSIMENDNVTNVFYGHNGIKSSSNIEYSNLPWLIKIEIDREKMLEKEITLTDIKAKFSNWWEKRMLDSKIIKKEETKVLNKITKIAVLSNSDNDIQPIIHIRFNVRDNEKDVFNMETISNFIDYIIDKFELKGIESVSNISAIIDQRIITFDNITGNVEKKTQYVISTEGINMNDIRYLVGIDLFKSVCNDLVETYNNFGIEIAREVLLIELKNAFTRAGKDVNYQHFALIVDLMTMSGSISSIDRHGMNKYDNGPLCRASFEKSIDQLLNASVFGEVDNMKGTSARIMVGAVIKGGTGYCNTVLNTDMIEKAEIIDDTSYTKNFIEINSSTIANDIKDQNNTEGIFIPL